MSVPAGDRAAREDVLSVVPSWLKVLWMAALMALMTYLLVGSSPEFLAFTPLRIPAAMASIVAFFAGIAAALATKGMKEILQMAVLVVFVMIPLLAYTISVPLLWVVIGGEIFMDLFLMAAAQRLLECFMSVGVPGLFGAMLGIIIGAFRP